MKLSKAAILALKGTDKAAKDRIAKAAGVEPSTVYRWISKNDDSLTKAAILPVISEETGLDQSQILEEEVKEGTNADQR